MNKTVKLLPNRSDFMSAAASPSRNIASAIDPESASAFALRIRPRATASSASTMAIPMMFSTVTLNLPLAGSSLATCRMFSEMARATFHVTSGFMPSPFRSSRRKSR